MKSIEQLILLLGDMAALHERTKLKLHLKMGSLEVDMFNSIIDGFSYTHLVFSKKDKRKKFVYFTDSLTRKMVAEIPIGLREIGDL